MLKKRLPKVINELNVKGIGYRPFLRGFIYTYIVILLKYIVIDIQKLKLKKNHF